MPSVHSPVTSRPLRLWPGIAVAVVIVLAHVIAPLLPGGRMIAFLTSAAGGILILLWWLLFSRAPWKERLGAVLVILVGTGLTWLVVDPSIAGGAMGNLLFVLLLVSVPPLLVVGAVLSRRFSPQMRWTTMALAILVGCGVWIFTRTDGVQGEGGFQITWRWKPTAEERLLAQTRNETLPPPPAATPAAPAGPTEVTPAPTTTEPAKAGTRIDDTAAPKPVAPAAPIAWSGFRGAGRDGVIGGTRIRTDWNSAPPKEVWRRLIGPGWSSFAVAGDLIYTQEQRGEHELVSAYRLSTGAPVWRHQDTARFYESNGGAGPRGTPTLHNGRVYTMGATGIVNALDAATGAVVWTKNAETDTGAPRPLWGFTASPVVVGDLLVTAASGRLAAYDLASGALRWTQKTGGGGYSSPHIATVSGVQQILLANGGGLTGVGLDGTVLWSVTGPDGVGIVQPLVLEDGSVLFAPGDAMGGLGLRRLTVTRNSDGSWKTEERWTSRGLKPYFNHYVVHKGHAYGFDGTILSAINLDSGERVWKGGRYGAGQMMLLPDQDLLLLISEEGALALVAASPDKHSELATFKAIEGKTWNHPVLVGDLLLVRNGEEMAAFRLPVAR